MANWKNWRQSHASVMSLVNADSESDDNQSVASELERTAHSVSTVDMLTISTPESIQENSSDTDDFDFVEETISDSESEAEILMDESGEEENNSTLAQDLAVWATEFPLPRDGLNGLLKLLRKQGHRLPKDSRTLMQTPRTVQTFDRCGGQYKYYSIESGLLKLLEENPSFVEKSDTIKLLVNIDGVPIFKSSGTQFWPVLFSFENFQPFLAALYYGNNKPNSASDFLKDFLEELSVLQQNGIMYETKKINVALNGFICDAPARSF